MRLRCERSFGGAGALEIGFLVLSMSNRRTSWVLENIHGIFGFVFAEGGPRYRGRSGGWIGGYDLLSSADRALGIDYTGSGRPNRMVLDRPGTGTFWGLQRDTNDNTSERLAWPYSTLWGGNDAVRVVYGKEEIPGR